MGVTRRRRVVVTIDRLVLRGIPADARAAVAAALEQELGRRIGAAVAAGSLVGSLATPTLGPRTFALDGTARPADIGRRAGTLLAEGLLR
jgi:hypothetical protein